MEIKEVRYDPENVLFEAECDFCNHTWYPFENTDRTINPPVEISVECPECGKKSINFFPDSKMRKEILYRKHVLGYDGKIKNAKKKVETLEKECDEWKNRYEKEHVVNEKLIEALDRFVKKFEQIGVEVDDSDKKYGHFS